MLCFLQDPDVQLSEPDDGSEPGSGPGSNAVPGPPWRPGPLDPRHHHPPLSSVPGTHTHTHTHKHTQTRTHIHTIIHMYMHIHICRLCVYDILHYYFQTPEKDEEEEEITAF